MNSIRSYVKTELFRAMGDLVAGECETHGAYQVPEGAPCPHCHTERLRAESLVEIAAARRIAGRALTAARLGALTVPKRFADASFDNFSVHGLPESAAHAERVCRRYASKFSEILEHGVNLTLVGSTGTGKTHLACAIARQVAEAGYTVLFTEVAEIARRIRDSYARRDVSEADLMAEYGALDLLILDEVGVQSGTDHELRVLTEIINLRSNAIVPTVVISNLRQEQIAEVLGERVASRLTSGRSAVVGFTWSDQRPSRGVPQTLGAA